MSFSQDTKQVKISTLKNLKKAIDKCDSLRIAYNEALKEKELLENKIIDNSNKFKKLEEDKKILQDKIEKKENEIKSDIDKKFHIGFQLGLQPIKSEESYSTDFYLGIGITYSVFSF